MARRPAAITNSQVSGYDVGTFFDGTFQAHPRARARPRRPDRPHQAGHRIDRQLRNITISNCVFDRSRGLALETVDGGSLEDVTISNITMRDVTTAPLFLRLGNRGRGPDGTPIGVLRRVTISNLVVSGADPRYASIIAGLPGHPVEDVDLSNIRIIYKGGGTREDAAREVPENETAYPEPNMFGTLPVYGLFVRHARNLKLRDVEVTTLEAEQRPPVLLHDVSDVHFDHVKAPRSDGVPFFVLRDVKAFTFRNIPGLADGQRGRAARETVP